MNVFDDDQEILDLVNAGDPRGFDIMVERYGPMLYRYAIRMCGDPTDAEDTLQDTFLTAQQKIHQFRGQGKLKNWLFKIAGNNCLQKHRDRKSHGGVELKLEDIMDTHQHVDEGSPPEWRLDPSETLLSAELSQRLESAIATVPATNRSVLILRDLEGLSTRETAEALEITEETVKVRLHRARAFVRNQLKDYFEG